MQHTRHPGDPHQARRAARREAEERSLDMVQRVIISVLVVIVLGTVAVVLAAYLVVRPAEFGRGELLALWVQTGVIGLITAAVVLFINRRRPYAPWVLLGLLPMAISAWWIL